MRSFTSWGMSSGASELINFVREQLLLYLERIHELTVEMILFPLATDNLPSNVLHLGIKAVSALL